MYTAECTYAPGSSGLLFLPANFKADPCELRVTFRPLAYYPAERDTGAGADFDAAIASIEIRDADDPGGHWHVLDGQDYDAARRFLERHHPDMWDTAFAETEEAFGVETYARAA